ncbi:MAG: ATP-binding protein, partial [Deltaproteobacteria bacterium]|nr:ATP-binding protein [Nannocystaceae bacterium]
PRPARPDAAANEKTEARNQTIAELASALREGVPDDPHARDDEQRARMLLAELLSYHRREDAATWWDYYRLAALDDDDGTDDREAIAGLELESTRSAKTSTILRLRFPPQELTLKVGDGVHVQNPRGAKEAARDFGKVVAIDRAAGWVELYAGPSKWSVGAAPPSMVFRHNFFKWEAKAVALQELARTLLGRAPVGDTARSWDAARSLLLRASPRLHDAAALRIEGEDALSQACRCVLQLDRSLLPVQGPPGTGKTHTGAEMILRACAEGLRVGVTAGSHAAIRNLLAIVIELGAPRGASPRLAHRTDDPTPEHGVTLLGDSKAAGVAWNARAYEVLGGTPFFWARSDLADSVDVLFVDEAGQLSLADTLAVCGAAKSVVLLGDPQQLQQPCKASHPGGAEVSALRHLLGDAQTIADDRGIFLGTTWRLPPRICALTSRLFYDDKLTGLPALEQRALLGATRFAGHGIWRVAVAHEGCSVRAPTEVEAIAAIVDELLGHGVQWRDADGVVAPLQARDILVVAPYNAQVDDLAERLRPLGVTKVGTVDRFQGQQAPVVIWSMTSSTADDAPRGLAFLYDGFRLNVATSRAKVACIVVGSPSVFDVDCRTAEDVRLVNRWCALAEYAREPGSEPG